MSTGLVNFRNDNVVTVEMGVVIGLFLLIVSDYYL